MSDNFAKPVSGLGVPALGNLDVAAFPTGGQGLALTPDGKAPLGIGATQASVFGVQSSSALTLTTAQQAVPGLSQTFTVRGNKATYFAILTCDFLISVTGTGTLVGFVVLDGINSASQALWQDQGIARATVSQTAVNSISRGSHTVSAGGLKTVNAGTAQMFTTHSTLTIVLFDA